MGEGRERLLALFGLSPGAETADVKARYRELARRFHPDTNPGDDGATARFRAILAAYQQLLTPAAPARPARAIYIPVPREERQPHVVPIELGLQDVARGGRFHVALADGRVVDFVLPDGADEGTVVHTEGVAIAIRFRADPRFGRRGSDLTFRLGIDHAAALTGARRELVGPDGRVHVVSIPPRSRWSDVLRIGGGGLPSSRGRGDLFVELIAPPLR